MIDSKEKLLKFVEEHGKWEKERAYIIAHIDVLNENQIGLVKYKEKEKEKEEKQSKTCQESMETNTKYIVKDMSQVSLK